MSEKCIGCGSPELKPGYIVCEKCNEEIVYEQTHRTLTEEKMMEILHGKEESEDWERDDETGITQNRATERNANSAELKARREASA